jgi:uncharacterized protein YpuA (DUF1002 family)
MSPPGSRINTVSGILNFYSSLVFPQNNHIMTVCHQHLLYLLIFCCLSFHATGSRINIVNNGYRDVVVAISPNVLPDQAGDLLEKIQVNPTSLHLKILFLRTITQLK